MIRKQLIDKGQLLIWATVILAITFPEIYIPNEWWSSSDWHPFLAYGSYFLTLLLLSIVLYWVLRYYKVRAFSKEHFRWRYIGYVMIAYGAMVTMDYLGLFWINSLGESTTANEVALMEEAAKLPLIITIIGTNIFGPFTEEVICRSLLNKLLFKQWRYIGILASSLLFGALHGPTNLPSWIIYAGSGLIFATVYELTDDLAFPIALHVLNNAVASLLIILG